MCSRGLNSEHWNSNALSCERNEKKVERIEHSEILGQKVYIFQVFLEQSKRTSKILTIAKYIKIHTQVLIGGIRNEIAGCIFGMLAPVIKL